jgi:hypothetical protein
LIRFFFQPEPGRGGMTFGQRLKRGLKGLSGIQIEEL